MISEEVFRSDDEYCRNWTVFFYPPRPCMTLEVEVVVGTEADFRTFIAVNGTGNCTVTSDVTYVTDEEKATLELLNQAIWNAWQPWSECKTF